MRERKWFIILLVVIFAGYIWYSFHDIQTDNLNDNVSVSKKNWTEENVWTEYNKNGFMIENNNEVPVDVVLTVSVYDGNGGYSHEDRIGIDAVAPESEFFFEREYGSDIERVELTEYECKKSAYHALEKEELEVSTDTDGKRMTIRVKNKSDNDTSGCNCTVVFYYGDQLIRDVETVEMHNGKIPSGETVAEEIFCPLTDEYDSMKIYTNAYIR